MPTQKYRIAVIGCGKAAIELHLPGYVNDDDLEVVAVSDIVESARNAAQEKFGIPNVYGDYIKMLEKETLDAVSVVVPYQVSAKVCRDVANFGVHVLCEKPLAENIIDAVEILDLFVNKNLKLKVNMVYRGFPEVLRASRDIRNNQIGDVYYIEFRENAYFSMRPYYKGFQGLPASDTPYWGAPPENCRMIWEGKSIHYIDLVVKLTQSKIKTVYAQTGRHGGQVEIGDNIATAILITESGVRAHLMNNWGSHNWGTRGAALTAETRIEGEQGMIWVKGFDYKGDYEIHQKGILKEKIEINASWPEYFALSLKELCEADENISSVTRDEQIHLMQTLEAGYISAQENRVVNVNENILTSKDHY